MILSIFVCLGAFVFLLWILRRDRVSLGLPIAYLFSLLLIHLPGAYAHVVGGGILFDTDLTELGIGLTAIGAMCFVAGVWLGRFRAIKGPIHRLADRHDFWLFCLIGGWFVTYGLSPLGSIPSIGAAVEKGGAVWILGVLLGLRAAMMRGDAARAGIWLGALAVYPVLMLLLGGFLSYGSTAIIIALSVLTVSIRHHWRVVVGILVASILGFNFFLAYFKDRDEIRGAVWGGASLVERIDVSMNMVYGFEWFDPTNETQLNSLDQRLNQNYFVGLAAARLQNGEVDYLYGRSLWEGLISLVPRVVWPDKPVYGGSPAIVTEMTGLMLSDTTSWGVGNVMEFYINFGTPSLVAGFLILGWLIGRLDRMAAVAEGSGDLGKVFICFLPAVALIQPNGSLVELTGGSAAALVAAYGWRWAWTRWSTRRARPVILPNRQARRGP